MFVCIHCLECYIVFGLLHKELLNWLCVALNLLC
jgi:hypothetical protein